MTIDAMVTITFEEEDLLKDLKEYRSGDSNEDISEWIYTEEGNLWILKWISNHTNNSYDELPDWSEVEILEYLNEELIEN